MWLIFAAVEMGKGIRRQVNVVNTYLLGAEVTVVNRMKARPHGVCGGGERKQTSKHMNIKYNFR